MARRTNHCKFATGGLICFPFDSQAANDVPSVNVGLFRAQPRVMAMEAVSVSASIAVVALSTPSPRAYASLTSANDGLYLFGGWSGDYNQDLFRFSTTTSLWTKLSAKGTPPPASDENGMTSIDNVLFLYGGNSGGIQ